MSSYQIHNYSNQFLAGLGLNNDQIGSVQQSGRAELQTENNGQNAILAFVGSDGVSHQYQVPKPTDSQLGELQLFIAPATQNQDSIYGSQFSAFDIYALFAILLDIAKSDKEIATKNVLMNNQSIKSLAQKTAQLMRDEAAVNMAGAMAGLAGASIQGATQIAGAATQIVSNGRALNDIRTANTTPGTNTANADTTDEPQTPTTTNTTTTATNNDIDQNTTPPAGTETPLDNAEQAQTQQTQQATAQQENAEVDQKLSEQKATTATKRTENVTQEMQDDLRQTENTQHERQLNVRSEDHHARQAVSDEQLAQTLQDELQNLPKPTDSANGPETAPFKDAKLHQIIQVNKFRTDYANGQAQLLNGLGLLIKTAGDAVKSGMEFQAAQLRADKELVQMQKELTQNNNELNKQMATNQSEFLHQVMDTLHKIMEAEAQAERKVMS